MSKVKKVALKTVELITSNRKELDQFRQELLDSVEPLNKLCNHIKGKSFEYLDDKEAQRLIVDILNSLIATNELLYKEVEEEPLDVGTVEWLLKTYGGCYRTLNHLADKYSHMVDPEFKGWTND